MSSNMLSVDVTSVIVFAVFGLILGIIIELLLHNFHIPIPYTVLVFYVGVIAGVVISALDMDIAEFLTLSSVSADLIVYGFLPTLLFSETMGLNIHHLFQSFNQALILAGPGAIIVCLELAVCAYLLLPFNWSWMYCFLFGAILSATDPVSVVSLMKSTNCSTKLTMIISGESLLNDGSAMILYLFFFNMINGFYYNASNFISFCAEMLILSPLIGFVIGGLCSLLMRRINMPTNTHIDFQLICTFIAAYLSYYIAAQLLDISGVLSCCTAGFTVSLFAPVRVLQDEKFHQIWSYAEWACNTLIFLLAGVIGGGKSSSDITLERVGYLVLFFVILTITRGIMSFSMMPFLNRSGEPCTVAETLFMTFAGLRGALGIALALASADNASDNGNDTVGKDLFFMVSGLASFTLLFNGSTAGWVLLKLKLVDDPNAPISPQLQQVLERIRTFISSLLKSEIEKMKDELGDYDEQELQQLCELLYQHRKASNFADSLRLSIAELSKRMSLDYHPRKSQEDSHKRSSEMVVKSFAQRNRESEDRSSDVEGGEGGGNDNHEEYDKNNFLSMRVSGSFAIDRDLLHYTRTTFLTVVRARYSEAAHTGKMSSTSTPTRILYYSVDVALDRVSEGLLDWNVIISLLKPPKYLIKICQLLDDVAYLFGYFPGYVSWLEVRYERVAIYVITNFIYAHKHAQSKIHYFLGGPVNKTYDIAEPEHRQVMEESKQLVEQAEELLKSIPQEDVRKVNTHRAAKIVLLKQADILHSIVHDGILSEKNANNLLESLERERDRIHVLRANHEKTMIKENIKERIEVEKEIRESFRSQTGGGTPGTGFGGGISPVNTANPSRSNLRMNLTGEDNFERLSTLSRGSSFYGGTAPFDANANAGHGTIASVFAPSAAIPIPSVTMNPLNSTGRITSGSYRTESGTSSSLPRNTLASLQSLQSQEAKDESTSSPN